MGEEQPSGGHRPRGREPSQIMGQWGAGGRSKPGGESRPPSECRSIPHKFRFGQAAAGGVGEGPSDPHNHGGSPLPTSEGCLSDAETGPHDGRRGVGHAAGVQLPYQHKPRDTVGRRNIGSEDLPTDYARE